MAFTVTNYAVDTGADVLYSAGWQVLIESELLNLTSSYNSSTLSIDPHDAFKYEGDFYGLLAQYNIPQQYFFAYLRANGLRDPSEFPMTMSSLIAPSPTYLDNLKSVYMTTSRKTNGI